MDLKYSKQDTVYQNTHVQTNVTKIVRIQCFSRLSISELDAWVQITALKTKSGFPVSL
jgi:hypothetical protein